MQSRSFILGMLLTAISFTSVAEEPAKVGADSLYRALVKSVAEANFEAMAALYHPDAVLVTAKYSKPVSMVIPRWKAEGEKLKRDGGSAFLSFRFSSRLSGDNTAFDTGIFRYGTRDSKGSENIPYVHFQDLNVKSGNQWLTLMERQMDPASLAEWDALPTWE